MTNNMGKLAHFISSNRLILASYLIYGRPFRHTSSPRPTPTSRPFRWQPAPISVLVWVPSFIEPDVLKTMYRSTIPLRYRFGTNIDFSRWRPWRHKSTSGCRWSEKVQKIMFQSVDHFSRFIWSTCTRN